MNMHVTLKHTPAETALLEAFAARASKLPGGVQVAEWRDQAMEMLRAGLPTRRVEAWHYTDLRRLLTSVPEAAANAQAVDIQPLLANSTVLRVSDGQAEMPAAVEGVSVSAWREGVTIEDRQPLALDDAIGALNAAFVSDGFLISVSEKTALAAPVELQNLHAGGQVHTRFEVEVGSGASATFVERQTGSARVLCSSVSEVKVGDGAEVLWLIVQEQPEDASYLGQFRARLGRNAKLTLFFMNAGGRLVRQEVLVEASGEGSDFQLRGVNLLSGEGHTDVTMVLNHAAPATTSREVIRNVLTDRAHGVFQGRINVHQVAQKTDAKMACNTLLLSDDAEFSTKPELEIFADDVACGHGATVTDINESHLFYLKARGVPEKVARGLLVKAFLAEVIEELDNEPIVEALEAKLDAWFVAHG